MSVAQNNRQTKIFPNLTGFNATAINSSADGNWIDVTGWSQLCIVLQYTRAAGTGVQFNILCAFDDEADDGTHSVTAYYGVEELATTTGETDIYRRLFKYPTSSTASIVFFLPVCARAIKIVNCISTGSPTASDKATFYIMKAQEVI